MNNQTLEQLRVISLLSRIRRCSITKIAHYEQSKIYKQKASKWAVASYWVSGLLAASVTALMLVPEQFATSLGEFSWSNY
jgi:hypothetical protein